LPIRKDEILLIDPSILRSKNDLEDVVNKSTRAGKITLIDRAFGRGTDFKCFDPKVDSETIKGVLVI
jgi:hypothetical protein